MNPLIDHPDKSQPRHAGRYIGQANRRGFSILELMVVMVLIAIISSIALPKINTSQYRSDAAMRALQGVLQQAQRSAIQTQNTVMVSFDTVANSVRVVYDVNNNRVIDLNEVVRWKHFEEGAKFASPPSPLSGNIIASITGDRISVSTDGLPTVYYKRNGTASTGYQIHLTSARNDKPTDFRGLKISQATGRVEVYRLGLNNIWQKATY